MDDLYLRIALPFVAGTVQRAPEPDPTFMETPPVDTARVTIVAPADMPRPRIALRFGPDKGDAVT